MTIAFLDWIWPTEVNEVFKNQIPAVIAGESTPEQATAAVQEALNRLVKEEDYSYDWWNNWTDAQWEAVTLAEVPAYEVK